MLVTGEWQLRDDGVVRSIIRAKVSGSAGTLASENFSIDSGADRTVLSAVLVGETAIAYPECRSWYHVEWDRWHKRVCLGDDCHSIDA